MNILSTLLDKFNDIISAEDFSQIEGRILGKLSKLSTGLLSSGSFSELNQNSSTNLSFLT